MTNSKTLDKHATGVARLNGTGKNGAAPTEPARSRKGAPVDSAAEPRLPAPAFKTTVAAPAAPPKSKLVRDSFTIPKSEYAVLDALKLRAARLMRPTKKSEVLRAGIAALAAMDDKAFLESINGIPSLKTGRPKASAVAAKPAAK